MALQPPAPTMSSADEIVDYRHAPLGSPYVEWIYLVLFGVGAGLHGCSLSQKHPRLATTASFVVGYACLNVFASVPIAVAEKQFPLLGVAQWEFFFWLSQTTTEGTFCAGIVLAISALAAAAAARAIVGLGFRLVSSRPTAA